MKSISTKQTTQVCQLPKLYRLPFFIWILFCLGGCGANSHSKIEVQNPVQISGNQVSCKGKLLGELPSMARLEAQKTLEESKLYPKLPDGTLVPEITRLADGKILLSGGVGAINTFSRKIWIFDPKSKKLTSGPALANESIKHATLLLSDGRVLISGGSTARPQEIETIQIFDPAFGTISSVGKLVFPRYEHAMSELEPGVVAITGGATRNGDSDEIELLQLKTGKSKLVGHLSGPRKQHDSMKINRDSLVVLNGRGFEYTSSPLAPELVFIQE